MTASDPHLLQNIASEMRYARPGNATTIQPLKNVTASAQVLALNQTITNIRENAMAVRVGNRRLRSPLPVITITGKSSASGYADADSGFDMAVSGAQLNRFEQFLFRAAVVLAGLLIVARIVAMVLLAFAHHTR